MVLRLFALLAVIAITFLPLAGCTGQGAGSAGGGTDTSSDSDDGSSNTTTN